jgi:hypothetical protein
MAPEWARATRPLVLVFMAICFTVTWIFEANVDAQGGAYATGVLVLMSSAAIAVTISAWRDVEQMALCVRSDLDRFHLHDDHKYRRTPGRNKDRFVFHIRDHRRFVHLASDAIDGESASIRSSSTRPLRPLLMTLRSEGEIRIVTNPARDWRHVGVSLQGTREEDRQSHTFNRSDRLL